MSRAFTRDGDEHARPVVPPRAPLPEGTPNYVTPRGLARLKDEMEALLQERKRLAEAQDRRELQALDARREQLAQRLRGAVLVDPSAGEGGRVRFGTTVRVMAADGSERAYCIVGVDEAEPAEGRIAFTSPIARGLLGKEAGESAVIHAPRGDEELEVLDVTCD